MAAHTGADEFLPTWMGSPISIQTQIVCEALVIVTDWIASSETLFPYDFATPTPDRVRRAVARL
ncbi:HD domain-containing protein, partial [Aeromonas diversa]